MNPDDDKTVYVAQATGKFVRDGPPENLRYMPARMSTGPTRPDGDVYFVARRILDDRGAIRKNKEFLVDWEPTMETADGVPFDLRAEYHRNAGTSMPLNPQPSAVSGRDGAFDQTDEAYEIDKLLGYETGKYRVQWKPTWEPKKHLSRELLNEYHNS